MTLPSPAAGWAASEPPVGGVAGAALVDGEGALVAPAGAGAGAGEETAFVAELATGGVDVEGAATVPVNGLAIWISAPSEGRYEASTKKGERFSRR